MCFNNFGSLSINDNGKIFLSLRKFEFTIIALQKPKNAASNLEMCSTNYKVESNTIFSQFNFKTASNTVVFTKKLNLTAAIPFKKVQGRTSSSNSSYKFQR